MTHTSLLPTKKSVAHKDGSHEPLLIYGPPKIGKSSFCAGIPNAVFFATEPGINFLEVFKVEIDCWNTFLAACGEIRDSNPRKFTTIVIDTLDQAYRMVCEHIAKEAGVKFINDLEYGKGYALANAELQRVLLGMSQIGFSIVMTSHSQAVERKGLGGVVTTRIVPTMPEKARQLVVGFVSYVLYADNHEEVIGDKIESRRVIHTSPSQYYEAGYKTRPGVVMPEIVDLSWVAFLKATKGETV